MKTDITQQPTLRTPAMPHRQFKALYLFVGSMVTLQVVGLFPFFLLIVGMIALPIVFVVASIFAHFGIYFLACRDVCAR